MEGKKEVISCPACAVSLNVPQKYSGTVQCPKCELEFERNFSPDEMYKISESSTEIRAGVTTIDTPSRRTNSDILVGFALLILYWGILFSVEVFQVIVLQKEIIEHPSDDEEDSVEVEPECDWELPTFDAEECELSGLKDQRNVALLDTLGPGINLVAFFLIHRGFRKLQLEK